MWAFSQSPASSFMGMALLAISTVLFLGPSPSQADGGDFASVLAQQKNLTTYQGLFKSYPDLFANLPGSGVTILAPSDGAFTKAGGLDVKNKTAVQEMLQYHMLSGKISTTSLKPGDTLFTSTLLTDSAYTNVTGGQKVIITKQPGNDVVVTSGVATRSTITTADVAFSGGLLQVVDSVLVTPTGLDATTRSAYTDLTAFLGALYTTDLITEFATTPNITLFIPHNAGFQLLAGTLSGLDKAALTKVLRYHLVPGNVAQSADLKNGTALKTSAGPTIRITRFNNNIYVDSAQIIQTDILIANGVVQMIDNVLSPDKADARPDVSLQTQAPVFTPSGASATGTTVPTPFASALPCTADCPVSGTGKGGVRSTSSSGFAAPARCTGAVGMAGAGVGMAVGGMLGLELMGMI